MSYVLPILMIVTSNVFYNLLTKATPGDANPFASLVLTYLTAAGATFLLLLLNVHGSGGGLAAAFRTVNWTGWTLGLSIICLEIGYILAYRAGWNISVCSLVANITLAALLLAIGVLFFKEHLSHSQIIGLAFCAVGMFFINR